MRHGDYWIAVISHQRPNNVRRVFEKTRVHASWYVGSDKREAWAYQQNGARNVVTAGRLCAARNRALEDAFAQGLICVQLSDDPGRMARLDVSPDGAKLVRPRITFQEALGTVRAALDETSFRLGGGAPNDFISWHGYTHPVTKRVFVLGDFMMIKPTPLRFDEALPLKEDYDYSAQHIKAYGGVARCNRVLLDFDHRTNAGGAVSYRTKDREREAIAILREKWGDWIQPNHRSPDEILFKPK